MDERDVINHLVDLLGCTRHQARELIFTAEAEGYNLIERHRKTELTTGYGVTDNPTDGWPTGQTNG